MANFEDKQIPLLPAGRLLGNLLSSNFQGKISTFSNGLTKCNVFICTAQKLGLTYSIL